MDLITQGDIEKKIYTIRGSQVMMDRDLAELYQVDTRNVNQAVKRNIDRFPAEFRFQMTEDEFTDWKSQSVMSNSDKMGLRRPPYVYTEQGVAMLSAVLRSDVAVKVSIQIMQAFVSMRRFLTQNLAVFQRLDQIEMKQLQAENKFERIFQQLEAGKTQPDKGIFFNGQMFDAYVFVADLIKKAEKDIIVIDNYVDESVLQLLTKRKAGVKTTIFTRKISKVLAQDLKKHNSQYETIEINELKQSHDRFLVIDREELYHIGASLKDLGKKWFAFSKMSDLLPELLAKLPQR